MAERAVADVDLVHAVHVAAEALHVAAGAVDRRAELPVQHVPVVALIPHDLKQQVLTRAYQHAHELPPVPGVIFHELDPVPVGQQQDLVDEDTVVGLVLALGARNLGHGSIALLFDSRVLCVEVVNDVDRLLGFRVA